MDKQSLLGFHVEGWSTDVINNKPIFSKESFLKGCLINRNSRIKRVIP